MPIAVTDFSPVEQTAFLTLYARAVDGRRPASILGDTLAGRLVDEIDYNFAGFNPPASVVRQTALRAKMLDDRVRDFTIAHPDAVVVDLGAGLSTGMLRVRPPDGVDWYSIDLPRVIALRDRVLPAADGAHSVAASLAETGWTATMPAGRPTILIADGLFAFVPQPVMAALLRHITGYFRGGELAFNDYGRVGRLSAIGMKLAPQGMFGLIGSQWANPGFTDPHVPEAWGAGLTLVEEAFLAHAPEVAAFPGLVRATTRLSGRFTASARKARILRYRF